MFRKFMTLAAVLILGTLAAAQTENLLYTFTETSIFWPQGALIEDAKGNLYGTTAGGSTYGVGSIYELTPGTAGNPWNETTLYTFQSWGGTGYNPDSSLYMDSKGALYGTTYYGGDPHCLCGVIYKLTPPKTTGNPWNYQVLHSFTVSNDGKLPYNPVIANSQGDVFGTTLQGGTYDSGTIYELIPATAGKYTEKVLYSFGDNDDASVPNGPLTMDSTGALYGAGAMGGAFNEGAIFKLTPPVSGSTTWTESILYSFGGGSLSGGITPIGNLVFDSSGNLYGVTNTGGNASSDGVIYELSPATGSWLETVLFDFNGTTGRNPEAGLVFGSNGSLYGTTSAGNPMKGGSGIVFQLLPPSVKGGAWTESTLFEFSFFTNGALPAGQILIDSNGNLDGTTLNGGVYGCDGYCGVVYQIVP